MKVLCYDSNGFLLASQSLLDDHKFLWPKSKEEIRDTMSCSEATATSYIKRMSNELHIIHAVEGSGN